jgi:hypothetical protein
MAIAMILLVEHSVLHNTTLIAMPKCVMGMNVAPTTQVIVTVVMLSSASYNSRIQSQN